jgi:hypothetical protein
VVIRFMIFDDCFILFHAFFLLFFAPYDFLCLHKYACEIVKLIFFTLKTCDFCGYSKEETVVYEKKLLSISEQTQNPFDTNMNGRTAE